VDEEIARIIRDCHEEAIRLLTAHRRELDALADALLARETLDEREILNVTGLPPAPALANEKVPRPVASLVG
jgi:cell division protease FtsH